MKKPTAETVATTENIVADESAAAAEASCNLVPLHRSSLRSSLRRRNHYRSHRWFQEWEHEKGGEKIQSNPIYVGTTE
jgi:hypothetical protein